MRERTWGVIMVIVGTCLIVPLTIAYWIEGTMHPIGWVALALSTYLFYSEAYDHLMVDSKEVKA